MFTVYVCNFTVYVYMYVMYSYNYVAMYVCMYFIFLWQGRTAMADCQSIIINQSINQSINLVSLDIILRQQAKEWLTVR